jgi:phosphoribosylformylglycinamidine synthase subunit PurL
MSRDEYKAWAQVKPLDDVPESTDIAADLLKLMASPALASRRWIWEQYDNRVGADTVQPPGGDAAVVRVHGSKKAVAITTDCTPRYCYADPYEGGKQAIAEAYRNLCAVGARPLAVTNCLNFGNPQRPEIMAQFVGCLEGMTEACRALDFPIVSGNVSLYNESKATGGGSAILPTPAIGGVGLLDDWEKSATIGLKTPEDDIYVVGGGRGRHLGQSLWLREVQSRQDGPAPTVDLTGEYAAAGIIRELIKENLVTAVHDVSDGGLLVAVSEMALAGGFGATLETSPDSPLAESWFGEDQGRYVVTVSEPNIPAFEERLTKSGIQFELLGEVDWLTDRTGVPHAPMIIVADENGENLYSIPLVDLRAAHEGFFPKLMGNELTPEF